jgi:hypothetical protein
MSPLQYLLSRSEFGFEFAEIFVEKRLSDSPSRGVEEFPNRRVGSLNSESMKRYSKFIKFIIDFPNFKFDYGYLREFEAKIGTARKVV